MSITTLAALGLLVCIFTPSLAQVESDIKPGCFCEGVAKYNITFSFTWSARRHPTEYPSGQARWSPVAGVAHCADYEMWRPGGMASLGMETLAELGNTAKVAEDIAGNCPAGCCGQMFEFECDVPRGTCTAAGEITVAPEYPYVSWASMFVPSPDWFTGDYNQNFCKNGAWQQRGFEYLDPWDSGTDSGNTYLSEDRDRKPQNPIFARTVKDERNQFFHPEILDIIPVASYTWELTEVA